MDDQPNQPITPSPISPQLQPKPSVEPRSKLPFLIIIMVLLLALFSIGAYYLGKNSQVLYTPSPVPLASVSSSVVVVDETVNWKTSNNTDSQTEIDGVKVKDIKYVLPAGWDAKYSAQDNSIRLSPNTGGGVLVISSYDYNKNLGRREFYCQIGNYCLPTTNFAEVKIGNISGYLASGLDNSGGGNEYFGAKGGTFYVITTFNPPSPNEFEKYRQQVLDSLVF